MSPLLATDEQLASLGETFVLVASHDPLRDEGIAFAERIVHAGGRVQLTIAEGFAHGLLSLAGRSPAASQYFDELVTFLRRGIETDLTMLSRNICRGGSVAPIVGALGNLGPHRGRAR